MRHELREMIALAERMIASGVPGTLATLFAAHGSTYRPLGSMMVSLPGMHAGGVSGGCLEAYVAREGVLATRRQPAAILSFSTAHQTPVGAPVLGCGGSIEILVERLTSGHVAWLKELSAATAADAPSVLQCLVDSSGGALDVRRQWLHVAGRTTTMPHQLEVICRRVLREAKTCHLPPALCDSLGRALLRASATFVEKVCNRCPVGCLDRPRSGVSAEFFSPEHPALH